MWLNGALHAARERDFSCNTFLALVNKSNSAIFMLYATILLIDVI